MQVRSDLAGCQWLSTRVQSGERDSERWNASDYEPKTPEQTAGMGYQTFGFPFLKAPVLHFYFGLADEKRGIWKLPSYDAMGSTGLCCFGEVMGSSSKPFHLRAVDSIQVVCPRLVYSLSCHAKPLKRFGIMPLRPS